MRLRPPGVSRWVLLAPAAVGAVALVVVTRGGAHASPDSAFYVGLARNVAGGVGWESPPGSFPLSHFPPLFPAVLAVFGWLGLDPLDAAGWLNPVLFGLSAALMAVVVRRASGSAVVGAGAAVALVVSRDLLFAHSSALSEPLFILLTLGTLVALGRYLESAGIGWLAAAAGLAAAATLTRYAGIVLVAAGVVAVLAGRRLCATPFVSPGNAPISTTGGLPLGRSFPEPSEGEASAASNRTSSSASPGLANDTLLRRVGLAAGFAVVALLPTLVWLAFAGSGDRPLGWHPFGLDYLLVKGRSVSAWILPRFVPWPARGVLGLAMVTVVAVVIVRDRVGARSGHVESHPPTSGQSAEDRLPVDRASADDGSGSDRASVGEAACQPGVYRHPLVLLCGLFAVAYGAILAVQNALLDASSTLDYRLLAPVHAVVLLGGAIALAPRLTNLSHFVLPGNVRWEKLAWVGPSEWVGRLVIVLVAAQAVGAVAWVAGAPGDHSPERRGLTAAAWEDSAVLAAVAALPADVVVYSNAPDAVHLLTSRRTVALVPPSVDYLSGRQRQGYEREMATLATGVMQGQAVVAWFGAAPWRRSLYPAESTIVATLGLDPSPVLEDDVGRLYRSPSRTGVTFPAYDPQK